ncbi:MAG: DNA polymerase sliding clamp [Candidatus Odinarchaeota archaeon]|nr:DNA polymerase sliding clamp [Candidatus Odinarchaeota archaeon]
MFEASISDPKLFATIIKALAIIDEGTFVATPEKLYLSEMDPAKVAMVEIELPNSVFDKYICEEKTLFKVDLDEFRKVARRAKSGDIVELFLDDKENVLKVRFIGKVTRTFSIALQETEEVEARKPNIPFKVNIKLLPDVIKSAVQDAKIVGEYVEMKATSTLFTIRSSSNIGEIVVEINKDDETVLEYVVEEDSRAVYPLNYLEDMIAAVAAADVLTINFATDMPLKMEYLIPGGGKITYYLAPKREA